MPNIHTQVVLVYLEWFWRNSLLKCVLQPKIAKNSLKNIFGAQCRSRSSVLVPPESTTAVLVMISSKSVSICNRFHARWANRLKMTISKRGGGTPLWCPRSRGSNLLTQRHQIISLETRDSRLLYSEDPESLSHLGLVRHRVVTDRQTDRIAIANTRYSSHLCEQLWRVKTT